MRFTTTIVWVGWSIALAGQTFNPSANPVSDAMRETVGRYAKNLVASAELLPAEKYGFRPTEAQMTFGQLIVHIVQTNMALCAGISGAPGPMTPDDLRKMSDKDPKDALVAAMRRSFEYCTEALGKM